MNALGEAAPVPGLLVAPTEPRSLKAMGKCSGVPERFGCDLMWAMPGGLAGVQRKEFKDLLASISDGRLSKEIAQMSRVKRPVLLIEGEGRWTLDGELADGFSRMQRSQLRGLLCSVQERGIWVQHSDNLSDTASVVRGLVSWTKKSAHRSLQSRPRPKGRWGTVDDRGWALHLLTSFSVLGPVTAKNLIEHFGGVPLKWTVDEKELSEVPGIGRIRAQSLIRALERTP